LRSTQGRAGIRHIVVAMMENRSFDHMLGWVDFAPIVAPTFPNRLYFHWWANESRDQIHWRHDVADHLESSTLHIRPWMHRIRRPEG